MRKHAVWAYKKGLGICEDQFPPRDPTAPVKQGQTDRTNRSRARSPSRLKRSFGPDRNSTGANSSRPPQVVGKTRRRATDQFIQCCLRSASRFRICPACRFPCFDGKISLCRVLISFGARFATYCSSTEVLNQFPIRLMSTQWSHFLKEMEFW